VAGALLGLLVVVLLTLGTAVFVAAEFSLVSSDRLELQRAADTGDRRAASVLRAIRRLSFQLSGAQLGITLTTLVVGFLAEPSLSRLLRPALHGLGAPRMAADVIAVVGALLVVTVLQMVLGELVPKNWAIARPWAVGRTVAPLLQGFSRGLRPVIALCNGAANATVRRLGVEPQEELRSARSAAELGSLVRTGAEQGSIPEATAELLERSLRFGDRTADEVMTPRTQVLALPGSASVPRLMQLAHSSGHSRFPVLGGGPGGLDDVIGVVHVKHALAVPRPDRATTTVADIAGPVARVPGTLPLDPLLDTLRRPGLQLAVVVDEYGGTAGVVTLEDLVEELLGQVADEYDESERADVEAVPRSTELLLAGMLRPDEVVEASGFTPPDGPYDTLGGFLLARLGRLAEVGDTVTVPASPESGPGVVLTVRELDGRRIDRVLLQRADDPDGPDGPAGPDSADGPDRTAVPT